jgi:hypothetical protein
MPSIKIKQKLKTLGARFNIVKSLYSWIFALGFDVIKFIDAIRGFPLVIRDYMEFKRKNRLSVTKWLLHFSIPCLDDKYAASGAISSHYFHQDLLVARRIYERNPKIHVDIGSRVDGFVAHVAAYRQIEVFDIRLLSNVIPNIVFKQADLMDQTLDIVNYCDSLSCLHALEHFGLGRYGDHIDVQGYLYGFENLSKILRKEGLLYLSVPIGKERIEFNAHRVFNIDTILNMASGNFDLTTFSYVDDQGDLFENIKLGQRERESNCGCYYGCGIFEFKKL